jgi:hypothetical protein
MSTQSALLDVQKLNLTNVPIVKAWRKPQGGSAFIAIKPNADEINVHYLAGEIVKVTIAVGGEEFEKTYNPASKKGRSAPKKAHDHYVPGFEWDNNATYHVSTHILGKNTQAMVLDLPSCTGAILGNVMFNLREKGHVRCMINKVIVDGPKMDAIAEHAMGTKPEKPKKAEAMPNGQPRKVHSLADCQITWYSCEKRILAKDGEKDDNPNNWVRFTTAAPVWFNAATQAEIKRLTGGKVSHYAKVGAYLVPTKLGAKPITREALQAALNLTAGAPIEEETAPDAPAAPELPQAPAAAAPQGDDRIARLEALAVQMMAMMADLKK